MNNIESEQDWRAKADAIEAATLNCSMEFAKGIAEIEIVVDSLDPEARKIIEPICEAYNRLTLKLVNGLHFTANEYAALGRSAIALTGAIEKKISNE